MRDSRRIWYRLDRYRECTSTRWGDKLTSERVDKRSATESCQPSTPWRCIGCPVREAGIASELSDEELTRIDAIATATHYPTDATLVYEGDEAKRVYNITSGVVRLTKLLPDGRRAITGFLYPGKFLGLSYEGKFSYTAEAITPVEACVFQRSAIEREFRRIPKLEHRLLSMVATELMAAQDQMVLLGRKTPKEKLASFLLHIAEQKLGRQRSSPLVAEIPMGRADIADYLGLTIETVSRTLTKFVEQGLIEMRTRREIVLIDQSALRDAAGIYTG